MSGFHFPLRSGYFASTGDNETEIVSTKNDPPKHRLGVLWQEGWGRSLGALSYNYVRQTGVSDEIVLEQGKMDDRFPLGPQGAGELRWDIKAPGPSSDGSMVGVMSAFYDAIRFNVPVYAPNLGGGGNVFLRSSNGRVQLVAQDDGNLVLYVDGVPVRALFGLPPDKIW